MTWSEGADIEPGAVDGTLDFINEGCTSGCALDLSSEELKLGCIFIPGSGGLRAINAGNGLMGGGSGKFVKKLGVCLTPVSKEDGTGATGAS